MFMGSTDFVLVNHEYAMWLLDQWKVLNNVAMDFRIAQISGNLDKELMVIYAANLTMLYMNLEPYLTGLSDGKYANLKTQFEKMQTYYIKPELMITKEHAKDLYELHAILRKVLELIKITQLITT